MKHINEYNIISNYYGDRRTERSGVLLINHIDEGISILTDLDADIYTIGAYCLHPMCQSDEELVANFSTINQCDTKIVAFAMEYRSVANEYLSTRKIQWINEIRLSPLKEVNLMLIADKMQNRKDFEIYHLGTHPRSDALDQYFKNWFIRLGIEDEYYKKFCLGLL